MTIKNLISKVIKLEGKKVSISMGNGNEFMSRLKEVCKDNEAWYCVSNYLRYAKSDALVKKLKAKKKVKK